MIELRLGGEAESVSGLRPTIWHDFFFCKKIYKHARLKGERFSRFFFFREKPR